MFVADFAGIEAAKAESAQSVSALAGSGGRVSIIIAVE